MRSEVDRPPPHLERQPVGAIVLAGELHTGVRHHRVETPERIDRDLEGGLHLTLVPHIPRALRDASAPSFPRDPP